MKTRFSFCFAILAALSLVAGCSTPTSVAKKEGKGLRRAYDVSYDSAWDAVQAVAVEYDLHLLVSDRKKGVITARRVMSGITFGDSVAIWIRKVSANRTEVEIISRRMGPPVPFTPNLEVWFLRSVTAAIES